MNEDNHKVDTIIIGGGVAGLATAMVLARANRTVIIFDTGEQNNKVSLKAQGIFSRDHISPKTLYEISREQLLAYPTAYIINAQVVAVSKNEHFKVVLDNTKIFYSSTLVLAQGTVYHLPDILGVADLWGTKVWNCPFCHGYEANNKKLLAIVSDETLEEMKQLLTNWSKNIIWINPAEVEALVETETGVTAKLRDGSILEIEEVVIQTSSSSRDNIANSLGCTFDSDNNIVIDNLGMTTIKNVYAVGDQALKMSQVNVAVASGHKVGISIVKNGKN